MKKLSKKVENDIRRLVSQRGPVGVYRIVLDGRFGQFPEGVLDDAREL